jgi:hypothetical protein
MKSENEMLLTPSSYFSMHSKSMMEKMLRIRFKKLFTMQCNAPDADSLQRSVKIQFIKSIGMEKLEFHSSLLL